MKRLLLLFMVAVPMLCSAQFKYKEIKDNPAYKKGAVSNFDGKVSVARSFTFSPEERKNIWLEVDKLYGKDGLMAKAPAKYYEASRGEDIRVYQVEDELVFNRSFINADVAMMTARLIVKVSGDLCQVILTNIKYRMGAISSTTTGMPHEQWKSGYTVADTGSIVATAEEYIADNMALTRKGNLVRSLAKYRVMTIDYVERIVQNIQKSLE